MIILDRIPIMTSRLPYISTIVLIVFIIAILRGMKRTRLHMAGCRIIIISLLFFPLVAAIEMKLNVHESGKYKYVAIFPYDKPEDTLDVYEIVEQRGNIYYLEDRK